MNSVLVDSAGYNVDYGEGDKYTRPAKREFPIRTDTSKNNDKLLSRTGV